MTNDKVYCIYLSPKERMIREHARERGFLATSHPEVNSVISPVTAEG